MYLKEGAREEVGWINMNKRCDVM